MRVNGKPIDPAVPFERRPFKPTFPGEQPGRFEAHGGSESVRPIAATPFRLRNAADVPRRQWLYGHTFIRGFVTVTAAPGGLGKSSLAIVEALALATGRNLLGVQPPKRCRVWLWNGEDPIDELERRVLGAALHFGIKAADLEGWLFVDSGRQMEITLAKQERNAVVVTEAVVAGLVEEIRALNIDLVVIDPFVSSHQVSENDNGAIDRVAKAWGRIADLTGCAVHIVAHTRKTGGNEVTADDMRGASALLAAARVGRVLNGMSKDIGSQLGIENYRQFFRVSTDKANLAPRSDDEAWFELVSVDIRNGDERHPSDMVGVPTCWQRPDAFQGMTEWHMQEVRRRALQAEPPYRFDPQAASMWIGELVGDVARLNPQNPADRARICTILKTWFASGALTKVDGDWKDEKGRHRPIVRPGELKD